MCGASTDSCDVLCGGGGCGRCGGESCDGAVTKADTAVQLVKQASDILDAKENTAKALLSEVCEF